MSFRNWFLLFFACCSQAQTPNSNLITTLAGTDGSLAGGLNALSFPLPPGPWGRPATDAAGNIYFSLSAQNIVLRLTPAGRLERFAGTGFGRFSGDGGRADLASLNNPRDIAIDSRGNVYIADNGNKRIRRVTPARVIDTVAGGGRQTPTAVGVLATDALLALPWAIAVDGADNLYLAIDEYSVGRMDAGSTQLRLYAGTPGAGGVQQSGPIAGARFRGISALAADKGGNLYLADAAAASVSRITAAGRFDVLTSRSVTGGVPADVTVDTGGTIYFSQFGLPVIWRLQGPNNAVDVYAGQLYQEGYTPSGTARDRALFSGELRLATDGQGGILVGDRTNGKLRRVTGVVDTLAGSELLYSGDSNAATAANFQMPAYVAQNRAGTYYFSDSAARVVFSIDPKGILRRFAGSGQLNSSYTDGKPSLEGAFGSPAGVAVDAAGVVYVADDDCAIRRIGADGVMRLHAGTPNLCGTAADGTPVKDARFGRLRGLTMDGGGNLYVTDITNHKVWRIWPDGTVRTFAGTGVAGSSSTALAATQTPLNTPMAVAVGGDGAVYISDSLNHRVVRVGPDGRSSPFAGTGQRGSTGDNGPASGAALYQPYGLAIDAGGNLFVAEFGGNRIRRIGATGTIITYAGTGVAGFRGDGGLATAALLNSPSGLLLNGAGELVIADRDNGRLRLVLNAPPTVRFSTSPITVTPPTGDYGQRGTVELTTPIPGLTFDASVRYGGAATGWLTVTPSRGTLPATLVYETNGAGLATADYSAQIVITVPSANPRETLIPITFRAPPAPTSPFLTGGNSRLVLSALRGGTATQTVPVLNPGGTPLVIQSSVTRGAFVSIAPTDLTVAPGQTGVFTVTAAAGAAAAGTYLGQVALTSGATVATVNVAFNVAAGRSRLVVSQSGLSFRAVAAGASVPAQILYGIGAERLAARATTASGLGWLTAVANGNQVAVSVNQQDLAVGDHYGRVEVFDGAAPGVRQFATVLLQVLPAGSDPGPDIFPSALIYTASVGGEVAGQEVELVLPTKRRGSFTVTGATTEGQPWLQYSPSAGTASSDVPPRLTVQPDVTGLAAGIYRGNVTVTLDDGQKCNVAILAVISAAATATSKSGQREASSCSNGGLFPQILSPTANFQVTPGEPVRLATRVVDGCGNLHQPESGGTAGVAVTGFGSQVVNLTHVGNGVWEGTATPNVVQASATLTFLGLFSRGTFLQAGAAKVNGSVAASQRPFVFADSLTDAASFQFGVPVAPGTLVSLFGQNLSFANAVPSALPLPEQLGGVEVRLNDRPIPLLFAGPGQVNAQIPYALDADAEYQLEIRRGSAITTPQAVVIGQARPGVFTLDSSGAGQGHVYRALADGSQRLADAANPAGAGDIVVIYCNGLGLTSPTVTAGAAAPSSPLAVTANPVTVTIGGQNATVLFAGLAPGFTGLYQINAQLPSGVAPGSAVPMVLSVAGQSSVAVTMGVR